MQFLEAVRARTHVKAEGEKRGASAPNAETEVETVAVAAS
jgi:hypothetical protein